MKKMLWVRADTPEDPEVRKDIVRSSIENGLFDIVVDGNELERLGKLGRFNAIRMSNGSVSAVNGRGEMVVIGSGKDVNRVTDMIGRTDLVVVSTVDWKVIPLENLIAAFQGSETRLLAEVRDVSEAALFLETLERGVDGVVLNSNDPNDILELRRLIDEMEVEHLELQQVKIRALRPVGTGDRVCIDTCSILGEGEGMLVGSGSSGMFLVHSESLESEYVEKRPFRVNAGSIHSYVLGPGDRTMYLSDLKVGDKVLAVDIEGNTRAVTVGRLKIERRPLLLIEAESDSKVFNIIVQNAETVRLVSDNRPVSMVDLKEGDTVLMRTDSGGRHFGMKVEETITEE